jgi:dTDP-4-dehydrorhamnose 3,5-epimerase
MELISLGIEGAWVAESPVWSDQRGNFQEWFKQEEILSKTGIDFSVQQANFSISNRGVIRGIHYSLNPKGQAKWITCLAGSIIDVIVDIRPNSQTFKKIVYVTLTGRENRCVLVGKGLGHGFVSLEDRTSIAYLLNAPYEPKTEFAIHPFDETLKINWGVTQEMAILSTRDRKAATFENRVT